MVIENKTIFNNNFEMGFVIFLIISNISIYYLSFNDNIQLIEYLYGNVNIVYIFAVISILNSFLFFLIKSNYYLNLSIPFFIYLLFFMSIIFGRGNQNIIYLPLIFITINVIYLIVFLIYLICKKKLFYRRYHMRMVDFINYCVVGNLLGSIGAYFIEKRDEELFYVLIVVNIIIIAIAVLTNIFIYIRK